MSINNTPPSELDELCQSGNKFDSNKTQINQQIMFILAIVDQSSPSINSSD